MAKTYNLVGWEDGEVLTKAHVTIDGTDYEVTPEEVQGTTPVTAENLRHMDEAIKDLYDGGASTTDIVIGPEEPTTEDWKIWIDTDEMNNLGSEVVDTLEGNETDKAPSVRAVNGTILFEGDTTENITLNDSVENYEYIEVHYANVTASGLKTIRNSGRLYDTNGNKIALLVTPNHSGDLMQLRNNTYTVSGTNINLEHAIAFNLSASGVVTESWANTNYIHIYKVIGYK